MSEDEVAVSIHCGSRGLGHQIGTEVLKPMAVEAARVRRLREGLSVATLFLCGDVMTGRGIDQILRHPSGQQLYEPYVKNARDYVRLAELKNGPIAAPVDDAYIWGDALTELERVRPDVRLVNLETAVTASDEYWPGKGINYRMHPENIGCLTAAHLDVCGLANNHVLDYSYSGLAETLDVLGRAGLRVAGAGRTLQEAQAPAIVSLAGGSRALVFAFAAETSGVPRDWAARADKSGVNLLADLGDATADAVVAHIGRERRPEDLVVASIHWGSNWGYEVPREHVRFARRLIDDGVHVVHGHSSHHPRPIEVYRGGVILYGCGDFINDYEGIAGHEQYRDDLALMYFAAFPAETRSLAALEMTPLRIRKMRLTRPSPADAGWMRDTLERINAPFGTHVELTSSGTLKLGWG